METGSIGCTRSLRSARRRGFDCAALALIAVSVSSAFGQQYQADEVDDQARRLSAYATAWIRDPGRYASDKDRFEEYFTLAYFPSMTQFGSDDLANLGDLRSKLFSDYLMKTSSDELRSHLTELAKNHMIKVVPGGSYHPAVRYNAVLVLGMLDKVYGDDRAGRLPQPLPDANKYLTQVVALAAGGSNVPPYVVVGALVGLERHARFHASLDPAAVEAMSTAVVKLLSNEPPLPELDRDVSEWIKLRGAAVLARLGSPGAKGEVHQALLELLEGQEGRKMTLDSRCQLAALMAMINYEGASVDAAATAEQTFGLAVDVAEAEAKRAKGYEDLQLGGGFSSRSIRGFGGRGGRGGYNTYDDSQALDRRILLTRLTNLRAWLPKARPLVPAERQPAIDAILEATKQAVDKASDKSTVDLDVARQVRTMATEIKQAADPGAAPAEEEPDDVF